MPEYVLAMQGVDGLLKLADMGIEGLLSVLVNVNNHTYVQVACHFTFEDNDIPDREKEEILSGCIGAILAGDEYHRNTQLPVYRNMVKHVPFLLTSPGNFSSSTWFTCMHMTTVDQATAAPKMLQSINTVTSHVKDVSLCSLDCDVREFLETLLFCETNAYVPGP